MDNPANFGLVFDKNDPADKAIVVFWSDLIRFMIEHPSLSPLHGEGHMFLHTHTARNRDLFKSGSVRRLFEHPLMVNAMACANTSWQIEFVHWFVKYANGLHLNEDRVLQYHEQAARRAQKHQLKLIDMCEKWLLGPVSCQLPLFAELLYYDLGSPVKYRVNSDRLPADISWPGTLSSATLIVEVLSTRLHKLKHDPTLANICDIPLPPAFQFLDRTFDPRHHTRRLTPEERDMVVAHDHTVSLQHPRTMDAVVAHVRHLVALWRESVSTCLLPVVLSSNKWEDMNASYEPMLLVIPGPAPFIKTKLNDPRREFGVDRLVPPPMRRANVLDTLQSTDENASHTTRARDCDDVLKHESKMRRLIAEELRRRRCAQISIEDADELHVADLQHIRDRELNRQGKWTVTEIEAHDFLIDQYYGYLAHLKHAAIKSNDPRREDQITIMIDDLFAGNDISEWEFRVIDSLGLDQDSLILHTSTYPVNNTRRSNDDDDDDDNTDLDDAPYSPSSSMTVRQQHAASHNKRRDN